MVCGWRADFFRGRAIVLAANDGRKCIIPEATSIGAVLLLLQELGYRLGGKGEGAAVAGHAWQSWPLWNMDPPVF